MVVVAIAGWNSTHTEPIHNLSRSLLRICALSVYVCVREIDVSIQQALYTRDRALNHTRDTPIRGSESVSCVASSSRSHTARTEAFLSGSSAES